MSEDQPIPGPMSFTPQPCVTCSVANPYGPEYGTDLPLLLRRVADQLEHDGFEPMDFLGLTVEQDIEEFGPWFSVTLFLSPSSGVE